MFQHGRSSLHRFLVAALCAVTVFSATPAFAYSGLGGRVLGTTTYAATKLTSDNNKSLLVSVQAVQFKAGKWEYKLAWKRTANRQGTIAVNSKDKTVSALLLTPAAQSGEETIYLQPGTRYRIEFYTQPSSGTLLLRKFFNTLKEDGTPIAMSQVSAGSSPLESASSTQTVITGTDTAVGSSENPCPAMTDAMRRAGTAACSVAPFVNVYKSNPPTGLAYPVEPQVTAVFNAANHGPRSSTIGLPSDSRTGALITNTSSSSCWNGTSDPYTTCNQTDRFKDNDFQEVWVEATQGRSFISSFYGPKCDDPNITIERFVSLPPGISQTGTCIGDEGGGGMIILGTLRGTPTTPGRYKSEFKVTKKYSDGKTRTATTRIYIEVWAKGHMGVQFTNTSGEAVTSASQGSRVAINVDQTGSVNPWNDMDFWAVPGAHSPTDNPEIYANSRILIGRYTAEEGWIGCDSSTAGGSGPIRYGCSRYNWLTGRTQGSNLAPGTYTIYAASHLVYLDRNGSVTGKLYGECQIDYPGCTGYASGGAVLRITAATAGNELPANPSNTSGTNNVASFSMLTLRAKVNIYNADGSIRKTTESSIGDSGTDNAKVISCTGGNDTGGVVCPGPLVDTNLKAGEYFDYEWSIMVPNTQYIDVRSPKAREATCTVVDVGNGGYWQGGDGMDCGHGSPIGGITARKGKPVPFTGAVDSTIRARGRVVLDNASPTDTQAALVRQCTSFVIPGGFDFNESQGYIHNATGKTGKMGPLTPACASILRGVQISQFVNVHIGLGGGGSTEANYVMGGMDFGGSCVGISDADLCPLANQEITGTGFFGRPGVCNVPDQAAIVDRLGLGQGLYSTDARGAGGDPNTSIIAEHTPYSGYSLSNGWAFDSAVLTLTGNGVSKSMALGNSSDPRWNKNVGVNVPGLSKSVACYYSNLNCGPVTYISSPEFTGLRPASNYTLTARFTCNGTNPAGANYRDASVSVVTANIGDIPVSAGGGTDQSSGSSNSGNGSSGSTNTPAANYFSSSNCYLPVDYESKLNLSCRKGSGNVTGTYSIPSDWKFDTVGFFADPSLSVVEAGCAGGKGPGSGSTVTNHCASENWEARNSSPLTVSTFGSNASYYSRMIFYCSSDAARPWVSVGAQCQ